MIGKDDRPATPAELERMKQLVAEAMEQGALGLSTSLQYVPDRFASTDEIVELAKVAARYGGVYFTHQRSESARIFESLDEVFAIAERARIPAEIWHLKTAYKANFGKMPEVLRRIEAARARGLDVTANQYPYTRASNGLDSCLPLWAREGGFEKTLPRLTDPATRERIKKDMDDPNAATWENQWYGANGGDGVMLSSVLNRDLAKYEGMTLTQIGKAMGKDPRDAVIDLVIADRGESSVITSIMDEDDVRTALKHPLVGVGTDSGAQARGRPALGVEVAPARVGIVPADPRPLRARRAPADARRGDPQDDVEGGRSRAPERSRPAAPGHDGRHHGLRCGDDPRRLDVRRSEALRDRRPARVRQRHARGRRRRDHGRAAGAAAARAGGATVDVDVRRSTFVVRVASSSIA